MKSFTFLLLIFMILQTFNGYATHVLGGVIRVERVGDQTYDIFITGFLNLSSEVSFAGGTLNFGDGSPPIEGNDLNWTTIELNHEYSVMQAKITHQYPAPGTYFVSFSEQFRSDDILNIHNSVVNQFYIETYIETWVSNDTPEIPYSLLLSPFEVGKVGIRDLNATDSDGDKLKYFLVVPKVSRYHDVDFYRFPNHPSFYVDYENYLGNGQPVFSIDKMTGTLMWDAPGDAVGLDEHHSHYTMAIRIDEYRQIAGEEIKISSTIADLNLTVLHSLSTDAPVILTEGGNFCAGEDRNMSFEVIYDQPYQLSVDPWSSLISINDVSVNDMADSTFIESARFRVVFQSSEEEQFVSFEVASADGEEGRSSSFTYLLAADCDEYVLSSSKLTGEQPFFYPNPATGFVKVQSQQEIKYDIIGLSGQRIKYGYLKPGEKLSLFGIKKGLYILQLYTYQADSWQVVSSERLMVQQ